MRVVKKVIEHAGSAVVRWLAPLFSGVIVQQTLVAALEHQAGQKLSLFELAKQLEDAGDKEGAARLRKRAAELDVETNPAGGLSRGVQVLLLGPEGEGESLPALPAEPTPAAVPLPSEAQRRGPGRPRKIVPEEPVVSAE
jgi:hypothetical protein